MNGTRVENARVNQVTELSDGDVIRIGAVKLKFQLPEPGRNSSTNLKSSSTAEQRSGAAETLAGSTAGLRWTVDELNALNQFVGTGVSARDPADLARTAVQALLYQTGATLVGLFTPDPTDPLPRSSGPKPRK